MTYEDLLAENLRLRARWKCLKIFKNISRCPGWEQFSVLIISVLQNLQAKTQAVRNRICKVSHPYSITQN